MAERLDRHYADAGLGSVSATVTSLPAGFTLGEMRVVDNVKYKLVYNAGNSQISQGAFGAPALSGATPNSITVSTASQGNNHVGAVQCAHATAATASYFWGLVGGASPVGGIGDSASIPTGSAFAIGDNGSIQLMPQSVTTGKSVKGVVITTVSNGGAYSGKIYILEG